MWQACARARGQVDPRCAQPGPADPAVQRIRGGPAAARGARARGRRLGSRPPARRRGAGGQRGGGRALGARGAQRAPPSDPRPLWTPHRRGGAGPVVALVPAPGGGARDPFAPVARSATGGPRGPRRPHVRLEPGERRRDVPGVHDLLRDPGPARGPGAGRGVGAAPDQAELRGRRPVRHGDDGEAGRLGRAGQQHARRAGRRRRLGDHRPQVVLLVPLLRHLSHARPDGGGPPPAS